MKLYFAGASGYIDLLRAEGVKSVLIAYPELRGKEHLLDKLEGMDVFLDCGAWSVASGAIAPISVDEYVTWLKQVQFKFTDVASLDVIGDGAATKSNYAAMCDAGVDVLPTWHAGEPLAEADAYAAVAPRMAIGGLASIGSPSLVHRSVAKVWPHVQHRDVHLFGVAACRTLAAFNPHSADTTGWLVGARYGEVYTLTRWPIVRNLDVTARCADFDPQVVAALSSEMARFGFSWRELNTHMEARLRYNARVLLAFVDRLNSLRRPSSSLTVTA